jgi:hypothetical protein
MDVGFEAPADGAPIVVRIGRPARRDRLTIFFRLLLALPQLVVAFLLLVLGALVAVPTWFAALGLGRAPAPLRRLLGDVVTWNLRVQCYLGLVTDAYPPWSAAAGGHAVEVQLPPAGRLNRLAVLGRIVMVIPAYVVSAVISAGLGPFVIFAWFAGVLAGRIPRAVTDSVATALRYQARLLAYGWLVTPTYPWGPLGDAIERSASLVSLQSYGYGTPPPLPPGYGYPPPPGYPPPGPAMPPADPDRYTGLVTNGGRAILIIAIVLGALQQGDAVVGAIDGAHIGTPFAAYDVVQAGNRFDRALDDASCPSDGSDCTAAVSAQLLSAATRLDRYARGHGATAQRRRLGIDLAAFETEVRRATRSGSLVDGSGEIVDTALLEDQTRIDHDVSAVTDALD